MQTISIQVKDLQKSYKELNVLKGVNFTVDQGSIFALLGSNGAGKTTLSKSSLRCSNRTAERPSSTALMWRQSQTMCGNHSV